MQVLVVVIAATLVLSLALSNSMVYAQNQIDRYWSALSGDQQNPPVNTDAIGYVGLKFQDDLKRFVYIVNAHNIGNVTGIYVYEKYDNKNGSMVLDLMNSKRELRQGVDKIVNLTPDGKITGTLSIGGITKKDLEGKSVKDFYNLMKNGSLYVNVNTKDYPNGEIRGNSFVPMDDLFPDPKTIHWDKQMSEKDQNTEQPVGSTCGEQCKFYVTGSINHAIDEIKNGNVTEALLHLEAAQKVLNITKD